MSPVNGSHQLFLIAISGWHLEQENTCALKNFQEIARTASYQPVLIICLGDDTKSYQKAFAQAGKYCDSGIRRSICTCSCLESEIVRKYLLASMLWPASRCRAGRPEVHSYSLCCVIGGLMTLHRPPRIFLLIYVR